MLVLVNPADVVAVPPLDNYQKIRACAYWPVAMLNKDEKDNIIIPKLQDGFADDMSDKTLEQVLEKYGINNEESDAYVVDIPDLTGFDPEKFKTRLLQIKESFVSREAVWVSADAVLDQFRAPQAPDTEEDEDHDWDDTDRDWDEGWYEGENTMW